MKNLYFNTLAIFIFFLFSTLNLSAQNYGYKGKPISIYYSFNTLPALSSPTWSDYKNGVKESSYDIDKFNTRHSISAEYVYNRVRSLGVKYQFFRTAMSYYDEVNASSFPVGLINHSFGVFYKMYKEKKGAIAPVGKYHQFDLMMINTGLYKTNLIQQHQKMESFNIPAFYYTFGNQVIFFDRLVTDIAYQIGSPIVFGFLSSSLGEESDVKTDVATRLLTHMLINISFTAGLNLM